MIPTVNGILSHEYMYAQAYGEERYCKDIIKYEEITVRDWAEELNFLCEKDSGYNGEKFHKEVILKLINEKSK